MWGNVMCNKYDIIVIGGGFAGFAASVSAARQGKNVLLIEKYNCLGGAACYNLVNPFMPYWTTVKESGERVNLSCGLFSEIINQLGAFNGLHTDACCFNEEILKYVLNRMATESGVNILFQTYVTDVQAVNGQIKSITVSNVSGSSKFYADYFIDATGDGNIAYLAGYKFMLGRESDNLCQPMTLCFRVGNVKISENSNVFSEVNKLYKEYRANGKIKNPREDVLVFKTVTKDIYHFNTTRVVKLNPTDASDVTKAEIQAREQVFELYDFLRNNFIEFKNSVLLSTGIQIGVRESRMIIGEHILTQEDIISCKRFEDSIAVCNYDVDIHSPDGSGTSHYYFPKGKYYTIPYRCLIPIGSKNLLVAGRCVSATHEAQASLRIMPTCCTLGEAAGTAAALAHNGHENVNKINIADLQRLLTENGAKIS